MLKLQGKFPLFQFASNRRKEVAGQFQILHYFGFFENSISQVYTHKFSQVLAFHKSLYYHYVIPYTKLRTPACSFLKWAGNKNHVGK